MNLTVEQMHASGMTPKHLKEWAAYIGAEIVANKVSTFKLKGGAVLPVRTRRASGPVKRHPVPMSGTSTHAFLGDEELRLTSLIVTALPGDAAVRLTVSLVPTDLKLQTQFSGLTLPVDDAINHLMGFEEWLIETQHGFADVTVQQAAAAKAAQVDAHRPPIITQQEFEQSEQYGSW